jgi:hypothetical protein
MEIRKTQQPRKNSLRRELENYVIAWNTCLRPVVRKMSLVLLLRNAQPTYRSDFAYKLRDAGLMTKEEIKEFVKLAV